MKNNNKRLENKKQRLLKHLNKNVELIVFTHTNEKVVCKCLICGEVFESSYQSLLQGTGHKSCSLKISSKKNAFSKEQIIEKSKSNDRDFEIDFSLWENSSSKLLCTCNKCGTKWFSTVRNILRERGCPSCGVKKRSKAKRKTIESYGHILDELNLELLTEYKSGMSKIRVRCKECNYEFSTSFSYLYHTKIGCIKCSRENLIKNNGQEFIERLKIKNPQIVIISNYLGSEIPVKCLCQECNSVFEKTPHELLRSAISCPICSPSSALEDNILKFLNKYDIEYDWHKRFADLRGVNDGMLSYDFYLPKYNLLIEAQGIQHEKPIKQFGGEQRFKIQQEHDKRKRQYAFNKKYDFLEIWYTEIDVIDEILINKLQLSDIKRSA